MKITFPHMGNMFIPLKIIFDTIGIDYVIPPRCSSKTLEKGVSHSPESICLPFKVMLGDFLRGIEEGADTILFGGGCGQCRFGYFGDLYAEIFKNMDLNIRFINLELNNLSLKKMGETFSVLISGKSSLTVMRGLIYAINSLFLVEKLYDYANYTRCREINKGETDRLIKSFDHHTRKAKGYKAIKKLISEAMKSLKSIKLDLFAKPLKIAINGDIYTASEPHVNYEIERRLGNMGIEVKNYLGPGMWVREHMFKRLIPGKRKTSLRELGKEYMKTDDIGGFGLETIGSSIISGIKGFDGVIQIYPFTCMPEIIAQSSFSELSQKYDIPLMSLSVDEMTGEAGCLTRIEAFVDMIKMKKELCPKINNSFSYNMDKPCNKPIPEGKIRKECLKELSRILKDGI